MIEALAFYFGAAVVNAVWLAFLLTRNEHGWRFWLATFAAVGISVAWPVTPVIGYLAWRSQQ